MIKIFFAVVFMGCVTVTLQKCYSYNCPHHEQNLVDCLQGDWVCQTDEFCEIQTHVGHPHGNGPWHVMGCRPVAEMDDCLAAYATNDAACDPDKHELICHWCCNDEACLQGLAAGNYAPPSSNATTTAAP